MPFVDKISDYKSVAIVGLDKNTGKTECLNYVLRRLRGRAEDFALTSIGIDGEKSDQVTQTPKPEISIPEGMVFVTSEKHYRSRRLVAEIMDVSEEYTALGRMVTARAVSSGKVLLSGPSDTAGLKNMIERMECFGVKTTIVDGALSRLSPASPAVTQAMILATGAAVSANIPSLVRRTAYIYELIRLQRADKTLADKLMNIDSGLWAVDEDGEVRDLGIASVFMLDRRKKDLFRYGHRLYVPGVISDKFLNFLRIQKENTDLIIRDFTRVFASYDVYNAFIRSGGRMYALLCSKLLAVTINPLAPNGFRLDSDRLKEALQEALGIPVYDVKRI